MKKTIAAILAIAMLMGLTPVSADTPDEPVFDDMADTTDVESRIDMVATDADLSIEAKSCVLMEAATGKVLYAENAEESLPPASVTKIMSLLLAMEAIDAGRISEDDTVQVSANAAGKGGSQVYLKEGEQITVFDLLKSIAVASGNDATAAIAEYIAGSEEAFVVMMNEKAAALGMANTTFINCTGLDDDGTNLTSAYDIALMSRELLKHERIFNYTTIWMDSIRDGQFGLNNTNKLVRFYSGTNGLKTGSTSKAKFCISATAKREDMQLIAVIMGAETSAIRNEQAKKLLDYGFANYAVATIARNEDFEPIPVRKGQAAEVMPYMEEDGIPILVGKGKQGMLESQVTLAEDLQAPVEQGQRIGEIVYTVEGQEVARFQLIAKDGVPRVNFGFLFAAIWKNIMI